MRRVFISADMEGIAGVASADQLVPGRFEWETARAWMTAEVSAAACAALQAGYDEVVIADGHGNAQNLLPDRLPAHTRLVRSWPRPLGQMQGVELPGVEGCLFIGFHAGAQSGAGTLAHSFNGSLFADIRLGGESRSEAYLLAAVAGERDIPVLLVSGDDAICAHVAGFLPDTRTCAVKQHVAWSSVISVPPHEGARLVGEATASALRQPRPAPFRLSGPHALEIVFTHPVTAELAAHLPGFRQTGQMSVATSLPNARAVIEMLGFLGSYPKG
jgi:D-amino peptidase